MFLIDYNYSIQFNQGIHHHSDLINHEFQYIQSNNLDSYRILLSFLHNSFAFRALILRITQNSLNCFDSYLFNQLNHFETGNYLLLTLSDPCNFNLLTYFLFTEIWFLNFFWDYLTFHLLVISMRIDFTNLFWGLIYDLLFCLVLIWFIWIHFSFGRWSSCYLKCYFFCPWTQYLLSMCFTF